VSRSWNGAALITEFATEQSDTSATHKTRVLQYINDGIFDIGTRFDWIFHRFQGTKDLTASTEEQDLKTAAPGAATVALASGGSLTVDTVYNVYITFRDSNEYETIVGTTSANITTTSGNLTISVSAIPTSGEDLVDERRVWLQKAGGNILLSSTIADNTTTTATITAEPTDSDVTEEAPDYDGIRKIDGAPFFESSPEVQLRHRGIDQMRLLTRGSFTDGTPELYSHITDTNILMNPRPSSALTLAFYYFRRPPRLYDVITSQPDLPIEFKALLRAYVIKRGYEFRDRAGTVSKQNQYEALFTEYVSRFGQGKNAREVVRDVYGDSDGFETTDT